jgi:N-hydroxyarylamine O-acetyltransferase
MTGAGPFDLDAYLFRVGYEGPRKPCLEVLEELHVRHAGSIPFENLDVRLGRPILLDLSSLQAKMVAGRRGGYCFEQNTLFSAALRALGFGVETLEARVRPPGAETVLPRTHMVLRVVVDGRPWLSDVGFGGDGPLRPVPLDGEPSSQPGGVYRVAAEGALQVLQLDRGSGWADLYAFGPVPALPVDYEVANHYVSTHPGSTFVRSLTVQVSRPEARHFLRGRRYVVRTASGESVADLSSAEIPALLRERFGLDLPDADVARALGAG